MKQRIYYLDNLCCLLLANMIFVCHIPYECNFSSDVLGIISRVLFFFMFWFFFKGGMVHKDCSNGEQLKKSAKRLLIPYAAFLVIGVLLDMAIKPKTMGETPFSLYFVRTELLTWLNCSIILPTAASWFLLSLYFARVVFNFLHKWIPSFMIFVASLGVAFTLKLLGILPYYVGTMFLGLAVYSIGNCLKEKQFNTVSLLVSLLVYILFFFFPAGMDFRIQGVSVQSYLPAVIYGIAGCVVYNNVFRHFLDFKIPIISYVGKNSMVYYLVHYPIMYTTTRLFWDPFNDFAPGIQYALLSGIVILALIVAGRVFQNKKLRVIVGG